MLNSMWVFRRLCHRTTVLRYFEKKFRYVRLKSSSSSSAKLKWSYSHGPANAPLQGITLGNLLQERVEKTPDKEAVVSKHQNIRKSFAQVLEESDQLAAGLLELGLKKGDRVGIWGPNSYEWLVTQYATARIGIILVNVNPQYRANELEYALKKVGCKAVIIAEPFKDQNYYEIMFHLIPELATAKPCDIHSHILPDLKILVTMGNKAHPGAMKFSEVMEAGTSAGRQEILRLQNKLQFDEPINIQFTSGTTGDPKGATLTHHNIINNCFFVGRRLNYHKQETIICEPVPLYHCFGMVLGSLSVPTHGAKCVFPSAGFDAGATLQAVSEERCTSLYGVPTMFIDMLNHPEFSKFDLTSLRTGIMAGSPCPIETMKQVNTRMHMPEVTVCYGTTETSPVTFQSFLNDVIEKRTSTVGKCLDHVEAKIVDEEGGIVPVGMTGELCLRGFVTMLNYWEDPGRTADVISSDRWYSSGDTAVMDEEGFCRIVGRLKDLIIRGGENVYPTEVEQVIYKHPSVKDVQVVGVPDARLGEEICAWIQLKEGQQTTPEDIREFCKDKLARYKIPKYISFVESYPLTVTGKVQKYQIRDKATKVLGLDHIAP